MKKLYNALSEQGKYTKSFEDFQTQFGSKEGQEKLYGALERSGDYTKSFEDFSSQFFSGAPAKTNDSASAVPAVESNQNATESQSGNGFSGQPNNRWNSENNRGKRERELKESEDEGNFFTTPFDDDPNQGWADDISNSFKETFKNIEKESPVFSAYVKNRSMLPGGGDPLSNAFSLISKWVQKDDKDDKEAIDNNPELFYKYNGYRNDVSIDKQAEDLYNNKDLDFSDIDSNLAYNRGKNKDFVEEYYLNNPESKSKLAESNVSAGDFQGFLTRKGYISEFEKQKDAGAYQQGDSDLPDNLTMQQDLKMYFDEYLLETASRNIERVVLKEIKDNPADYKEMTLPEAMDAADAKLMEDPEKNRYGTHLDFNKLENWNSNNWDSINKYDAEQLKNIEEAQQNRTEQKETGLSTGLYGTLKTIGSALGGLGDGLEDAYDFFKADGKFLGMVYSKGRQANEFRDLRDKSNRRGLRGDENINYLYAEGKQVTIDGKEYIKQANGSIKNITSGFDVSRTMSAEDRKAIDAAIEKGDYTYGSDFDGFGGSIIAGKVIGELGIQILGQKGFGALRKVASLKYLGKVKNLSKARLDRMQQGVNSKGNMRGVNYGGVTGGAKGTWDTFGKKIPLGISKGMADAVIFQSGYGAMTGYNQAKTAALDAGMSMDESESIANEASLGMAALFALTTPINPKTGLIDKFFKGTGKNSTANLFKRLINASGNAAGVKKNFGKMIAAPLQTRLAKYGATIVSEGAKEKVQENIQQIGEAGLNKVLNRRAGKDLLKDTYTYEDFINTSVLSFAAGGFAGGAGNISTLTGKQNIMNDSEKVQRLRTLMQNPAKVEKIFNSWVKNGDITKKEADGLNQEVQKFGSNINKMPKFLSDKRMSTELLKVIDSQSNITSLENQRKNAIPGEQVLIDEKLKVLKEQQTKLLIDAQTFLDNDNKVFEGKFTKNTAAVVNFAKKLGFGDNRLPRIFESSDAYVTAIYRALKRKERTYLKNVKEGKVKADPDFKPLTKAGVAKLVEESDGVYLGAGNLFINKEVAKQTGKWTVTSHEIIHPILNSLIGSYLNQKTNYDELMAILPSKVRKAINKKIKDTQGADKQATEFLNYLSDAIISGELDYDPSIFDKIRLWFNNIISKLGLKSGIKNHEDLHFDDARGVYNWLKEYTSGLKEGGEVSDKAIEAIKKAEAKSGKLVSEDPGLQDPENAMQFSSSQEILDLENALDDALDAFAEDPDNPTLEQNVTKAERLLEEAEERVASGRSAIKQEVKKDPKKDIEVFHGGAVKTVNDIDGIVYFSESKEQAEEYAKGNNGKVQSFKINESEIATEAEVFEVIRELNIQPKVEGWTVDDSRLYELIDARFDNAFTKKDLSRLNEALAERGIKATRFTDTDLRSGRDTENIVLFDKSAVSKKAKPKVVRPKKPIRTTDLGPRDETSQEIMDIYDEGMEGEVRTNYTGKNPLPNNLDNKLVPEFEAYINTIVNQKFIQTTDQAFKKADALNVLREIVLAAVRTYNPAKNEDLAGYVKKMVQTRQSLMFKDVNAKYTKSLDDAKGVTATEDTQSIDRSGTVERGQATFDELDVVDDTLIEDIKQDLEKEIRIRVQKGTLSETVDVKKGRDTYVVSWLENYVNKQLFKKLSKKLGAIAGVYPNAVIPGSYIDFLNDPKTFDIITKALPIKSIKKSYSKLFPVERVGREITAEGNPVFKISKIKPREFLTYFVKGNKSTVLERQKQLFREILEPLAKQVVADYATPENLAELKSIQELAPDVSQDVQAGIIIEAQLNELQSQLDRYKGEKSTFDIIQFSSSVSATQKANIDTALRPLLANVKNNEFKSSVIQDILDGLESVKDFGDLAKLVWTAGTDILSVRSTREYRAEVLNLLANRLNYVNTVKFLISAITKSQRIYAYQQKTIGYNYAISNFKSSFKNAKDDATKGKQAELFLGYVSRSIRTLGLSGITKNSEVYSQILKPILGDPTKYGFSLEEDTVKNRSYILRDGVRLQGLADITRIKSNFEGSVQTINKEAAEVRAWLLGEAKNAIAAKDTDAFVGFLSLLSADQRGPIRKMSTAGFAFEGLKVKEAILEHETEAKDIFIAWKEFLVDENEAKLNKALDGAKINLVSKKFDKLLRKIQTETGVKGKARYNDQRAIDFLKGVTILQFSKTATQAAADASKLNTEFNTIIQDVTGLDASKKISSSKATILGSKKGRFKFFLPPSAEDFAGLLYKITGKKKQGDAHQAWFKETLFDPFAKGIREFESYKQNAAAIIKELKKSIKNTPAGLGKINKTGFTNDVAVRVYLWNKNGFDIPDLTTEEQTELVDFVNGSPKLRKFARQLDKALNGYPEPQGTWIAGTVTTDAINKVNTQKRAEFLKEWQENADAIFTKDNISKLESQFGENYKEALKDILYRMKTGRNRPSGANKLTNVFLNWVNDSVGTIMFFNTRSALLQTLSIVNFINWGDNNPIEAAKAFSNQKQFWADFSMLFNSDFLKQRRSGLKLDVNADEIASAAETQTNKAKAAFAALLKAGFTPTQMADSFAIAMGGASFIRNRINKYVSDGMSKNEAEEKAFLDFQEIAEETQQSSRPDRVSQQQASPLGRIILAFANTPMQYMRLSKKAFLDLKNGRGDAKTNITKIIYYTAVQNIIFSSLQAALFAMAFDDDEEAAENKKLRVANSMLDSVLRGAGIYGAIASTIKNIIAEIYNQNTKDRPDYTVAAQRALSISPPVDSKMRKIMSAARAFSYKTTRDKMTGYGLDNPAYYAGGQLVSAAFNLPLDRVIRKADNLRVAVDNDTKMWQSIALGLGYSQWDLGLIKNEKSKGKSGFGTTFKRSKSSFKSGFGSTFSKK